MKKSLLFISGIACLLNATAQVSVQGHPYDPAKARRSFTLPKQLSKAANEAGFSFSDIENWSGQGANAAAVAIQWNNGMEHNALVWGFRWDGDASGERMLREIAKSDPRFFIMSEVGTAYGSTIAGIGYDANADGLFSVIKDGVEFIPDENGVILVDGYSYDGFTSKDPLDYWAGGWYEGYWSYWVKAAASGDWGYSSLGATNRMLMNGAWDGWNFAVNMQPSDWLPMAPAEKPGPSAPKFSSHPESITADPGTTLQLTVKVGGTTPVLQWFKDGEEISGARDASLIIKNAHASDSGEYYCTAVNSLGKAESQKARVKIGAKECKYILDTDNSATLVGDDHYRSFVGTLTIPAKVNIAGVDYPVAGISKNALANCSKLTEVVLPESIIRIDKGAFAGCENLKEVRLGGTRELGDSVFIGCSVLETVDFGNQLQSIGNATFESVKTLSGVNLPNTLNSIGNKAFYQCSGILNLALGNGIRQVGKEAFYYCDNVATLTIPASLTEVGEKAFGNMRGIRTLDYQPRTSVFPAYMCYYWSSLTEITLPSTVRTIDSNAFYYCSKLATINHSGQLETIGDYAFYNCGVLKDFLLSPTLKSLGQYAFYACRQLTEAVIPEGITAIGNYSFYNCSDLKKVILPSTLTRIGQNAFYGCKQVTKMILPESLTKIEASAFKGCGLKSIHFTAGISELGANAFENCTGLVSVEIPDGITKMGNSIFAGCSALQTAKIGSGLTSLGTSSSSYTFQNCKKLERVSLGAKLTTVGNYAFNGCAALNTIWYNSKTAPVTPGSSSFSKVPTSCRVFIPAELEAKFKSTNYWKTLTITPVSEPEVITWIGEGSHSATMVISWTDGKQPASQIWGYRWKEGSPTVSAMLDAIVSADPRLFSVIAQSESRFVSGLGYDLNGKNTISMVVGGNTSYPKYHETGQFTATPANYKTWVPQDAEDHWNAPSEASDQNWSCYLREGMFGWKEQAAQGAGVLLKSGDCVNWVFSADSWQAWSDLASFAAVKPYEKKKVDYTDGIFLVNEDWFGWDCGTVNFMQTDYEMIYRAFRRENDAQHLGVTTQYGTIYGDNFYFVSKQANSIGEDASAGGRLVVADAKTLKKKASFEHIAGGDGRSFLGVDEETGYIGTSSGIVLYDMVNDQVGSVIAETGGGSTYSGQIGNMARMGDYVFALKQSTGILVIDARAHKLVKTISYPNAAMLTEGHDGNIWVAVSGDNKLVRIDPVTFEAKEISCPAGVTVSSSWGAWNAGSLCSSTYENALFFITGKSFSLTNVVKYDMDKDVFDATFFILPDQDQTYKQIFYGAGLRMNPATRQLVLTATESGYVSHYLKNWIHLIDANSGALVKTVIPENYYWFPAMPVFPDVKAPEITRNEEIFLKEDEISIPIRNLVKDDDNLDASIMLEAAGNDESIATASVVYPNLVLKGIANGTTSVALSAISNGKRVTRDIPVTVALSVGVKEVDQRAAVAVYPNPATDYLAISGVTECNIDIFDMGGRCVFSQQGYFEGQRIETDCLPSGMYMIRIKNENECVTLQFMKN